MDEKGEEEEEEEEEGKKEEEGIVSLMLNLCARWR
jgi:hypothetical protein